MFDVCGEAFFKALRAAVERHLGRHHSSYAVIDRAVKSGGGGVAATHAVQNALAALEPSVAAMLMADVHKALREAPDGILARWRGSDSVH